MVSDKSWFNILMNFGHAAIHDYGLSVIVYNLKIDNAAFSENINVFFGQTSNIKTKLLNLPFVSNSL